MSPLGHLFNPDPLVDLAAGLVSAFEECGDVGKPAPAIGYDFHSGFAPRRASFNGHKPHSAQLASTKRNVMRLAEAA